MSNVNAHKNFTATGDAAAEALLKRVLSEIGNALSGTGLCIVLGGSYGRGDGGVRQDRKNGILYNDLDFFAFASNAAPGAELRLKEVAKKYEKELKVDVDFSSIMSAKDIRRNAKRLMMQELKRGYRLVCGEDMLEKCLPALPAEALPFSEACRLLLNRGMGLLLAGERIAAKSPDTDFILRNIYKAVLGGGDAVLIAHGNYRWKISERLDLIEKSDMPDEWKKIYREAVGFKYSPHRNIPEDINKFHQEVRKFFQAAILCCTGEENPGNLQKEIYSRCYKSGEVSLENLVKYCIKSRTLPPAGQWKYHMIPAVAFLVNDIYTKLNNMPQTIDRQSKLYQHWLLFN